MPNGLLIKLLLLVIIGAGLGAVAQTMLSPGQAPEVVFSQSSWRLLSDEERKILQPLADNWAAMSSVQQEKWRAIARKYPALSLREQHKIQRRMTRWAGAAPEQRAVARKKFQTYKQKKTKEQERVRSVWQNHRNAKGQANATPLPSGSESSAADGVASRETESPAGPPEDAGPATESPE